MGSQTPSVGQSLGLDSLTPPLQTMVPGEGWFPFTEFPPSALDLATCSLVPQGTRVSAAVAPRGPATRRTGTGFNHVYTRTFSESFPPVQLRALERQGCVRLPVPAPGPVNAAPARVPLRQHRPSQGGTFSKPRCLLCCSFLHPHSGAPFQLPQHETPSDTDQPKPVGETPLPLALSLSQPPAPRGPRPAQPNPPGQAASESAAERAA